MTYIVAVRDESSQTTVRTPYPTENQALGEVRVAIAVRMARYLREHEDLRWAQDHRLMVRPLEGAGRGLSLEETCINPPCPWFGQESDDPIIPIRTLLSAWTYEEN